MMTSPSPVKNIVAKYLETLNNDDTTNNSRSPLQPSSKVNTVTKSPYKLKDNDLDTLARQLNIPTNMNEQSPTKLWRAKFEQPSVTISAFKHSPQNNNSNKSSTSSHNSNPDFERTSDESPSWANKNYKDILNKSPKKMIENAGALAAAAAAVANTPGKLRPLRDPIQTPSKNYSSSPNTTTRKAVPPRPYLNSPSNNSSRDSAGYEYLCRIEAIRRWLEQVLQERIIQSPAELISYIRNGIHLAKLANIILPTQRKVFLNDSKLQFKHTENINRFFHLLDFLNVPDLFRFELTDLYDAKNVPKVWFCLHALSYILNKTSDLEVPKIESLVDKLDFDDDDIRTANRALVGAPLPNFSSADTGESDDESGNTYMTKVAPSPTKKITINTPSPIKNQITPSSIKRQPEYDPFIDHNTPTITKQAEIKLSPIQLPPPMSPPPKFELPIPSPIIEREPTPPPATHPELEKQLINIIKIQALSRGANLRYKMFANKILLKSYQDEFTTLFAIIRGNMSRCKSVHRHRAELRIYEDEIVGLQSIIRGGFLRKEKPEFDVGEMGIVGLQSVMRGKIVRDGVGEKIAMLRGAEDEVVDLQSLIRRKDVWKNSSRLIKIGNEYIGRIVELQSVARRRIYERFAARVFIDEKVIIGLQSIIRRNLIINDINEKHSQIRNNKRSIIELQSIARGGISRTQVCNNVLVTLIYEDGKLNNLYAKIRGNNLRRSISLQKQQLYHYSPQILQLQSMFRGILCRFSREIKLDDIYTHISPLIRLQSIARGSIQRRQVAQLHQYYHNNVDKVIHAQALLRRALAQSAYKQLINTKNPSLSIIRKFAHLLSASDGDYRDEVELSQARDMIIESSKRNEELEGQIEALDIKLSLLDRNKITIEEFAMPTTTRFNKKMGTIKNSGGKYVGANKLLDRLNKSSRQRIELYQTLFYLLQTKPEYFARLFNSLDYSQVDSRLCSDLISNIIQLFPNIAMNGRSREEFFYMMLIMELMKGDIARARNSGDITKTQSSFWIGFFLRFNNHTRQRQQLKAITGRFVARIVDQEELDFESDPSIIHASLLDHETKIRGHHTAEISPQVAIKIPQVSSKFVNNLMSLREAATEMINIIGSNLTQIPIHVRLICKHAYEQSKIHFPNKSDHQHLAVAGVIFIKHYISTILNVPENFGIIPKDPFNPRVSANTKPRDNLRHLSRVLLQLFSMKPFSDNFLKPLNDYIATSSESIQHLIHELIAVRDIKHEYNLNEYVDIVNRDRPELVIKITTLISLEKTVSQNIDIMAPGPDDQLLKVVNELDNLVGSPQDLVTLNDLGSIVLNLNPITNQESMVDYRARTLFMQVKRCVLYIIRIQQESNDLLELLISGIRPEHELMFKKIVEEEARELAVSDMNRKKKPYYQTSLGDLSKITYHDLKKMALENLLQLESMGELTRKNSFQEVLNQIVLDIKTKKIQRDNRRDQLLVATTTATKLAEKEQFLKKQLNDYNNHIDTILTQLQSNKKPHDKKLFNIIPIFSKQYFYHRELRKRNRLPRFGSYKYSAKKLMDQKILINFGGFMMNFSARTSKLDFMFSCHSVGRFTIEAASGSVAIPGASTVITLDELINLQYENKKRVEMFDGMAVFDSDNFMGLIFRKFYDIKRD
ncbi:IQG1 [[Candida] subhashii]|uniref:IQG1 n=1 Tax=[Candida] subhashii TaxID=561895 RepID=A0A8J5QUX5_9ASCO|nr:IQG1 [[Candida] subhashii]KAG7666339.1 IQG1 [[Candida] subhashii]